MKLLEWITNFPILSVRPSRPRPVPLLRRYGRLKNKFKKNTPFLDRIVGWSRVGFCGLRACCRVAVCPTRSLHVRRFFKLQPIVVNGSSETQTCFYVRFLGWICSEFHIAEFLGRNAIFKIRIKVYCSSAQMKPEKVLPDFPSRPLNG